MAGGSGRAGRRAAAASKKLWHCDQPMAPETVVRSWASRTGREAPPKEGACASGYGWARGASAVAASRTTKTRRRRPGVFGTKAAMLANKKNSAIGSFGPKKSRAPGVPYAGAEDVGRLARRARGRLVQ